MKAHKCITHAVLTASACFCASASGAEIRLTPISASGSHSVTGNEIVLQGGGQRVFLELQISGWDPGMTGSPQLRAFQAVIDSTGYTSGLRGTLSPASEPCTADPQCTAPFGGACSAAGNACNLTSDCQFSGPPLNETCNGTTCTFPTGIGGFCTPGFILPGRSDYVFFNVAGGDLPILDLTTKNYRFASATQSTAVPDPGGVLYAATLVLEVPVGAMGTFTIQLQPLPDTLLQDALAQFILPLTLGDARITIACASALDCDDGSACTDDACTLGVCSNTPNFNTATQCCKPVGRVLTTIDDGNACTNDVCIAATGNVTHDPLLAGVACGNPANSECNLADTCDGAGTCQTNVQIAGTACGDPTTTECNLADTCDGAGSCDANFMAAATPCGDPTADTCTASDACDGAGSCARNDAPAGTPCDDGVFCTVGETCLQGLCGSGTPTDCTDGLPCTTDTCNEGLGRCDNLLVAGACLINTTCRGTGELNPTNDCEACNPALTTNAWSLRVAGSPCDDGDACTGTGRPGIGVDACDGAGLCAGLTDPECNDECPFAVPVTEGATFSNNDNKAADDAEASCQLDSNNDVWFLYTASCTGLVFASTTGSLFTPSNDPVLSVWDDCPQNGGMEIACDDDSGVNLQAALTFDAVSGGMYRFRVAGFALNTGDIVLNISTVNDCLIGGTCYAVGDINPANDCEACNPSISTTAWSPRLEGSACGAGAETECDNPDACNGAGACEVNHKPDGTACSDDGKECSFDVCGTGVCTHPPVPAGVPCGDPSNTECDNADTCDGAGLCQQNPQPSGLACGDPSDDQCDHPDRCDGVGLCDANLEPDGNACNDNEICTGGDACQIGLCVGVAIPQAPLVTGPGARAVTVTPLPAGSPAPVALRVTSPDFPCLLKYVNAQGALVDLPVFRLTDDWGTVILRSAAIAPSTQYDIVAECGGFTSPVGSAVTQRWGDVAGPFIGGAWGPPDGVVDINDIAAMTDRFGNALGAPPIEVADLHPCLPNRVIDILDILQVLDAFQGAPDPCPPPCV